MILKLNLDSLLETDEVLKPLSASLTDRKSVNETSRQCSETGTAVYTAHTHQIFKETKSAAYDCDKMP